MNAKVSLSQLNQLPVSQFVQLLGGVFEHSPHIAQQAAAARPFASIEELHGAMVRVIESGGENAQLTLIRAHPELADRAAVRGELTEESSREQSGAGLNACSPEEFQLLMRLNDQYQRKFGFPFIVAVRGHTRQSIITLFGQRLQNDIAQETRACLEQIFRIGMFRLQDLVTA